LTLAHSSSFAHIKKTDLQLPSIQPKSTQIIQQLPSTSKMYSKITAAALAGFCMLSSASPVSRRQESNYVWNVSGLSVSCADNGCSYLFNIAGPADPEHNTPAFNAQCRAQVGPQQTTYRACDLGLNADGSWRPAVVEAFFNLDGTNFYQSELSVQITYPDLS
jgi:hypothetical protein